MARLVSYFVIYKIQKDKITIRKPPLCNQNVHAVNFSYSSKNPITKKVKHMFCRLDNLSAHIKKTHGVTWQVGKTFEIGRFHWIFFGNTFKTPRNDLTRISICQKICGSQRKVINDLLTGGRKDDKHKCEGRSSSTKDFFGSWLRLL